MIHRPVMIDKVCHTLQTEYVALLGQRGIGVTMLINTLLQHRSPLPGMKFISVTLPGVPNVREFKELFLRRLKEAIAISETELAGNILQLRGTADYRVRMALESLGRGTSANYLVIVLNGLSEVPDRPLKNFLQMLREYHEQMRMNYGGQAGEKLRFLIAGSTRLWSLCSDATPERSPFNIAKCIFLEGLSCEEIQTMDTCASLEAAVRLRDLTDGIPSLIEQAIQSSIDTNDLTLFFSYLQDHWNALHSDSRTVLKKLAEGSEQFPSCDPDPKCSQIPEIMSPWAEAFWGGFLRMRYRQLAWRSHLHQAFVMRHANMQYNPSISTIAKGDLLERTERLGKALKHTNYSRNSHEPIEEARSLASQTYSPELVTLLELAQQGVKSEIIVQEVEQLASLSERDWIKELAKEIAQHKGTINAFLLEAIIARVNHFLTVQFDVYLCHNGNDKAEVIEIGKQLKSKGILPWLDEWEIPPGQPWQRLLGQQIAQIKSAAVFIGQNGIGSWQREELDAWLREFIKRGCPVIPVFLMSASEEMEPPTFLTNRTLVDFRKQEPNPMEQLIWGITGAQVQSDRLDISYNRGPLAQMLPDSPQVRAKPFVTLISSSERNRPDSEVAIARKQALTKAVNPSIERKGEKNMASLNPKGKNEPSEEAQSSLQPAQAPTVLPTSAQLREAMKSAYNLGGLELLCADLNIHYGDLGEGAIEVKIQHLIDYCRQQRGDEGYEQLVQKVLEGRPHLRQRLGMPVQKPATGNTSLHQASSASSSPLSSTSLRQSATRVTNIPGFEHGYALIIGINRYQNLGKLSNAILKDAFDIQTILQSADYCGYARDHVRVLLNDEATADGIREGLGWLARSASSGATALVYFSGHGGRVEIDSQANHYLIPYNCDLADLDGTAISNQELTQLLHDIRASKFLALLDSCYSGGAAQAKGLRVGEKASEEVYYNELAHSQLDQGRGRIIIASSRSEEASHVLAEMDNSLFTHYLLEALRGKARTRGDGFIRVLDVYEHVAEKVPEHLLQHPIFQATNADNFPIALYLGGKQTANAPLIEEKPIPPLYICEHSNKPTQCRLWNQHPSGFFAVDAFPVTQYTPCPHCGHSGPGTLKQVN